jgi:hypothetical protein
MTIRQPSQEPVVESLLARELVLVGGENAAETFLAN